MTWVRWTEQVEGDVPSDDGWLSAVESERLHAIRFAKRRAEWRLGRWTAKCALTPHCNLPLADIEIRSAASGAPEVFARGERVPVTISLSHRAGVGVCGVAPTGVALGCDLELIEPRSQAFVADYFTPEEQTLIARTPADGRARFITLLWSAKECVLKALRVGLREDTRSVEVNAVDACGEDWHPLQARYATGEIFDGWWFSSRGLVRTLVSSPPASAGPSFHCVSAAGVM